jgi:hypothetical protein
MPQPQGQSWFRSIRSSARVFTGDSPEGSTPGKLFDVFQFCWASNSAAPIAM